MKTVGSITAYVGAMNAGKTSKLIDLYEEMVAEGVKVGIFKPDIGREEEDDDFVYSRNGKTAPAHTVDYLDEIPMIGDAERYDAILIDEIQFFDDGEDTFRTLEGLAMAGAEIYVFGLDVTSENETFNHVGDILAHADRVYKLKTRCHKCGEDARISKYMGEIKEDEILVGDIGDYQPTCRSCYYNWDEVVQHVQNRIEMVLSGDNFYFAMNFERDKLEEIGFDPKDLSELNTMEDILNLINKLKKKD